ncbi:MULTISPECIES: trypsin-like serine peptidase [unclassified Nocardioides]|uniref:trypsin-like serine peptidase n=1 Tax=unclassified Nocardioides TaxID=2615069 RepID=UPI003622C37D
MKFSSPVATDLSAIFDDLDAVAERVQAEAESQPELQESAVPGRSPSADVLDLAAREARGSVLADGARGLHKLARDPDADLTPEEHVGLEAIVLREGRPALFVQAGDFAAVLPPEWQVLDGHRAAIREAITRVGRIEVTGHPDLDWLGTGFLVAPDIVMTNRHVAREFAAMRDSGWTFINGRSASWDLLEEQGSADQAEFEITEIIAIHDEDDVDLALLRVAPSNGTASLPEPLTLTAQQPSEVEGRAVYVLGYPAWDGRRNDPGDMARIFQEIYNVKRLQPGRLTVSFDSNLLLRHDCSTLGGNSGSPVIDLETNQVLGLHFGGRYLQGNSAVPSWRLATDPVTAGAGLKFE